MEDRDEAASAAGTETAGGEAGAGGAGGDGAGDAGPSVPRAALEAERRQRQAAQQELATLRAERESAQRKAAEEAGEYQRLYSESQPKLEAATAENASLRGIIEAERDRRLEALPKSSRPPFLADLPLGKQLEALQWAEKQAAADKQARPGGTRAGGASSPEIPADCKAEAERHGMDPEWWFENVWKRREANKT